MTLAYQALSLGEFTVGAEYSEGDRQIETRPLFANVRGSEIDCGLLKRKEVTAVLNRRADAFARFAHCCVRQSDNRHRRRLIAIATDRS